MKLIEHKTFGNRTGARYRYDCENCEAWHCSKKTWTCPYSLVVVPNPPAEIRQKQNLRRFNHGRGHFHTLEFRDGESLKLLPASYSALAMRLKMEEP